MDLPLAHGRGWARSRLRLHLDEHGGSRAAMPAKQAADGTLANAAAMTLYAFDEDSARKRACNGPCAANRPPLSTAVAARDGSIVTHDDGSRQWAFKGKPLYTWVKDRKPGDKTGDGLLDNTWHGARE